MDTSKLRPDTARVWKQIQTHPALKGFVLIGGTALALRIGHRVSEDLDFAYSQGQLPQAQIRLLVRLATDGGLQFQLNQDPVAEEEFLNSGLDLAAYQQNYLVDGAVKVTFVAPEAEMRAVLHQEPQALLRVATLDEIFRTKCLACADRNKSRDWFDLFILIRDHGYTVRDLYDTFATIGVPQKYDITATRLRNCRRHPGDEGYEQLLASAPSDAEMAAFFGERLDQLEADIAALKFREQALKSLPPIK